MWKKISVGLVIFVGMIFGLILWLVPGTTEKKEVLESELKKRYAIVVSNSTFDDLEWKGVVNALQEKYKEKYDTKAFTYQENLGSIKDNLTLFSPDYIAFIGEPSIEINESFVKNVHQLTRELDDDPYGDAMWGIITGYTAEDALRIAQYKEPLNIKRGLSAIGTGWLPYLQEGVGYSETTPNFKAVKSKDQNSVAELMNAPRDTTKSFVDELNSGKVDIFWTSGHATEHIWNIGYSYQNGIFSHSQGQLIAADTAGKTYKINSSNPKIYYPVGNCLIGNIDNRDSMMTSWIRSGGAYQAMGYIVGTRYGFMGWGIADYFFIPKYPLSFAESFFLNSQAIIFGLEENVASNREGHEYDKDAVAFYGDPAWEAKVEKNENNPYDMELTKNEKEGKVNFKFTVKALKDYEFNPERPAGILLPYKIENPKIKETNCDGKIVITEKFVLMQITEKLKQGEEKYVIFEADL